LLVNSYLVKLREWILKNFSLRKISLNNNLVFKGADVHTSVIIIEKSRLEQNQILTTVNLDENFIDNSKNYQKISQEIFAGLPDLTWNVLISESNSSIIAKIEKDSMRLKELVVLNRGLITGDKKNYFAGVKLSDKYIPILEGGDVHRYSIDPIHQYVLFERPKGAGGCWDPKMHKAEHKIVIRQIGSEPKASYVDTPIAVNGNVFTAMTKGEFDERYLLAIINSRLIKYYWQIMFNDHKSSFPQVAIVQLDQIPIHTANNNNEGYITKIVSLVDQMLETKKRLAEAKRDSEREIIQRKCDYLDSEIDRLVYELYGLSEEEVKVVEG